MPSDTAASYVTGSDVSRFAIRAAQPQQQQAQAQRDGTPAPAPQLPIGAVVAPDGSMRMDIAPSGPTVRVTRGQESTSVPVGKTGGVRTDTARVTPIEGRK